MAFIAVTNNKGGVGKSTTSVHLAAWLQRQGHSVLLADCDAQRSSSEWLREACPAIRSVSLDDPDQILDRLPELATTVDYVVADGPGCHSETSRLLLILADISIVPCKASMLEVRALDEMATLLRGVQKLRKGPPAATIMLSMVGKRYRLTEDMREAAAALQLPIASTPWTLRQIYADAPGQGQVVWQMGSRGRVAMTEVDSIFSELLPDAVSKKPKKRRS